MLYNLKITQLYHAGKKIKLFILLMRTINAKNKNNNENKIEFYPDKNAREKKNIKY